MKNTILPLLMVLILAGGIPVTANAADFVLLELLIKSHKRESDRLKDRNTLKSSGVMLVEISKNVTKEFEDINENISGRIGGALNHAALLGELGNIARLGRQVVKLEGKAVTKALDNMLAHPVIYQKGIDLHNEFGLMIKRIRNQALYLMAGNLSITLSTLDQKRDFIKFLHDELTLIRNRFNKYISMVTYMNELNSRKPANSYEEHVSGLRKTEDIWTDTYDKVKQKIKFSF